MNKNTIALTVFLTLLTILMIVNTLLLIKLDNNEMKSYEMHKVMQEDNVVGFGAVLDYYNKQANTLESLLEENKEFHKWFKSNIE